MKSDLELWSDGPEVVGHDEGRREDCPDGHLSLRLVQAQAVVADDQLKPVKQVLFHDARTALTLIRFKVT